jgi:predicted Zn finger-like uncharacterized protein
MAATIIVACPECHKQIKAAADLLGKKVRCKACGHSFTAKAGPPPKAAANPGKPRPAKKAADDDEDANPYGVEALDLAPRCPNCANEMESAEAIICLYCGYNTQTRVQGQTQKLHDITGMDWFLWLLPGIACVLAIIVLVVLDVLYCIYAEDWTKDQWYEFTSHLGIKLWVSVMVVFACWLAGKFAFKRLVLNPHPPEIQKRK